VEFRSHVLGTSVEAKGLHVYELVNHSPAILIVGGMHGDEPGSAAVASSLVELIQTSVGNMMDEHLLVVPRLNPDGLERGTRQNARGVDLNRNFPTTDWKRTPVSDPYHGGPQSASEPETRMLLEVIRHYTPRRVLAIHAIDGGRHCVNFDGPAENLARQMAAENGYVVRPDMGYPTPGSLGRWCGFERKVPTVTLELPAEQEAATCWQQNRDALLSFIQADF
jgi:protein MpaA